MSKFKLTIIVTILLLIVTGCQANEQEPEINNERNEVDIYEDDWDEENIRVTVDDLTYYNEKVGYQLIFPESWRDYFIIEENPEGIAYVYFYGKSKTGRDTIRPGKGLIMFFILKDEYLADGTFDNLRKIGSNGETDFWYATYTDAELTYLLSAAEDIGSGRDALPFPVDEEEIVLARQDWDQLTLMKEDLDELIQSFSIPTSN